MGINLPDKNKGKGGTTAFTHQEKNLKTVQLKKPRQYVPQQLWEVNKMSYADVVEIKFEINQKLDEIKELLLCAVPESARNVSTGTEIEEMIKNIAEKKIENVGCKDVPTPEMWNMDDMRTLWKVAENNRHFAVFYALAIGFANGVEWERKRKE